MSKWSVVLALFVSILVLHGCGTTPSVSGGSWPADIPERAYYVDSFRSDVENQQWQTEQDYMRWVVRFYEGWALYPRGWKWLSDEVDDTLTEDKKPHMSQIMASLGERISAEWSKDGRSRTVNTTHLMIWGDALKLAVKQGSQLDLANRISSDVDDLLARRIQADVINLDRYFAGPEGPTTVAQGGGVDPFDDPFELHVQTAAN